MTRATFFALAPIIAWAVLVPTAHTNAAVKASDSASNPAYAAETDGAWKGQNPGTGENPPGEDNGGVGFLPWDFAGGYYETSEPYDTLSHFIAGVDFPESDFNDLGSPAFGLGNSPVGFSGATTAATRPFAQALEVGDVFSASIDTPAQYDDYTTFNYPFAIITFLDATGESTFGIEAGSSSVYGDFNWRYYDGNHPSGASGDFGVDAGGNSISPTATSDGSTIRLEVTSATHGRVTLDDVSLEIPFIGGLPTAVTFTLFDNNGASDAMGDPTGEHAFYFDDLKIETAAGGGPGDFDGDGDVDGDDLALWRGDFGIDAGSDADADGDSDGADFIIWQQNLGAPGGGGALRALPEPGTFALLAAACVVVAGCRRLSGARQR